MKTRILHTRFWSDSFVTGLEKHERYLYLYLLLNESINICGTYEIPVRKICFDTGLTEGEVKKGILTLVKAKKIRYANGWVSILNVDKYNSYTGEKNEIARQREMKLIPNGFGIDTSIADLDTSIDTSIDTHGIVPRNKKSEIRNQELVIIEEKESEEEEMHTVWNSVSKGRLINHTSENLKAYRKLKSMGVDFGELLGKARALRADKYQSRKIQNELTNFIGVLKHYELLENYGQSLTDRQSFSEAAGYEKKLVSV